MEIIRPLQYYQCKQIRNDWWTENLLRKKPLIAAMDKLLGRKEIVIDFGYMLAGG